MKNALLATLLMTITANGADAQKYEGSFEYGSFNGHVDNFTIVSSPIEWNVSLTVDKSQNVQFHDITFKADFDYDFATHDPGTVFLDAELSGTIDGTLLDMNPLNDPGTNRFGVEDFIAPCLHVSGLYHNRGFENQVEGTAVNSVQYRVHNWSLDYDNYPETIGFNFGDERIFWTGSAIEELEPRFGIRLITFFPESAFFPDVLQKVETNAIPSIIGDSNLDGRFDSSDLVTIFQAGEYEDGIEGNSVWETGDWNQDTEFDSSDLVFAFQAGTYEQPTDAVASVPEPTFGLMLIAMILCLVRPKFGV